MYIVVVMKTPCYANNFLISEVMDMAQLARGFFWGFQCHRSGLLSRDTNFFFGARKYHSE